MKKLLFLVLLAPLFGLGQISHGGHPLSFTTNLPIQSRLQSIELMPEFSVEKDLEEG